MATAKSEKIKRRWWFVRQFLWSLVCFLGGALLVLSFYDPMLLKLRGTVPHPRPVPEPAPGTMVVGPLAKGDWKFDSDKIPWEPVLPLAQISDAAYRQGDELEATLRKWGLSTLQEYTHGSMYACVASNDDAVVIAFRGTNQDQLADWLADANIRSDKVADGNIHQGFHLATRDMLPELVQAVKDQGGERKKVWVTGHSLGGAMALVFTYDCIKSADIKPVGLVTFGQPLVVDAPLAVYLNEQLKGRYVRFVHSGDAVTRIFPTFSHCGNLVWFRDGSYIFRRPDALIAAARRKGAEEALVYGEDAGPMSKEEFRKFQAQLKQRQPRPRVSKRRRDLQAAGAPAAIEDHYMAGYLHWIVVLSERERATSATSTPLATPER
ncbi:MAG: lipase family protein [Pirellulaceae bacterium]